MNERQINYQINHFQQQKYSQNYNFYDTLVHYRPLCTRFNTNIQYGKSLSSKDIQQQDKQKQYYVNFLVNDGWWKSFMCIMLMNVLFMLMFIFFILDDRKLYVKAQDQSKPVFIKHEKSPNYLILKALYMVSLAMINISYFLTQFLNPGIRNLADLPRSQLMNSYKTQFCHKCNKYKTEEFTHCLGCDICIWKFDHHCGFFGKCIGGKAQTRSFYVFLVSVTLGSLTLIACMFRQMEQL